jgi:hypothetical protein
MTDTLNVKGLVERLREEAIGRQQLAWGRIDGGQEYTLSAMLAEEAATALEQLQAENERLKDATRNLIATMEANIMPLSREEYAEVQAARALLQPKEQQS